MILRIRDTKDPGGDGGTKKIGTDMYPNVREFQEAHHRRAEGNGRVKGPAGDSSNGEGSGDDRETDSETKIGVP